MNIKDIILKKTMGLTLSREELNFAFNGYLLDKVSDYEMTLLLKAICQKDMSDREIFDLTDIYINSGKKLAIDKIPGLKVDKHSTGGVGDKTTLIIGSIVAVLGIKFVKMSGRGLGFTGGTIDELESIPGFKVSLTEEQIIKQVNDIGMVVTSQTEDLVPLDKKTYALRDVTDTVKSIPLIAVSIMSKKIVTGTSNIVIDIKVGNGAYIDNLEEARRLSDLMMKIGNYHKVKVKTVITDMNKPLGDNIGNSLEIIEAMEVLQGKEGYLRDVCIELASNMIVLGKNIDYQQAQKDVIEVLNNGQAYNKFLEFIKYQGGNIDKIEVSPIVKQIKSNQEGIIESISALEIGKLVVEMGAGRKKKEDTINYGVGIKLKKQVGDYVKVGETIMELYLKDENIVFDINKIIKIK